MVYDSIIIGAGPAGLSAAIYLGRFNRTTLVIDKGYGRSSYHQTNDNYLGFPQGIHATKLRELGETQARRFGVELTHDLIRELTYSKGVFTATGEHTTYSSKTIIFAAGVVDDFPYFQGMDEFIGRSLLWCITCDGYKTKGKRVVVVGHDDEAACTCLQFMLYTKDITFIINSTKEPISISQKYYERFKKNNIELIEDHIEKLEGNHGLCPRIILSNGKTIETDYVFSMQGSIPNSFLAKELGVNVNKQGYIMVNDEQRTNLPFFYAAGDVTDHFSHQIATAVHEGSMAAQAANYDLYAPDQKE